METGKALPVAKKALPVAKRVACELYAVLGRLRKILAQQGQFAYELYAAPENGVQFVRCSG